MYYMPNSEQMTEIFDTSAMLCNPLPLFKKRGEWLCLPKLKNN